MSHRSLACLFTLLGCSSSSNGTSPDAGKPGPDATQHSQAACPTPGTAATRLPACTTAATTKIDVPAGCIPTADGTIHAEEWSDAACVTLGASTDVVYVKYAAGNVYLAYSATPACGCGLPFAFDPTQTGALGGDEFIVDVFDDPSSTSGDRGDFVPSGGAWISGTAPAGVVSACVGNQPTPINYEFVVPFTALGITAGSAHTFGFAISHPMAGIWPATLTIPQQATMSTDPSTWGSLSSSANWH